MVHLPRLLACGLIWLSLLLSGRAAAGDPPEARFAAANRLYFEGRYAEAAETYAALVSEFRIEDPALYHNLGNAYFRTGAYGSAILYYKRALALEPDARLQDTLERNLDAARRTLQSRYRSSSDTALTYANPASALYRVTHSVSEPVISLAFVVLWTALFGVLILRRMLQGARWPGRVGIALAIFAALSGLMLGGRLWTEDEARIGVVVAPDAKIRDGKHEVAQGREIPEGLEVRIIDAEDPDWTQVELASGRRGWVDSDEVKQL
jgi:hypothetical protein